jgi:hypothetical protein
MDTRFLLEDYDLHIKGEEPEADDGVDAPPAPADNSPSELVDENGGALAGDGGSPGGVTVSIDTITQPGSVVSGSVVFSGGDKAAWSIDQLGRLGLDPDEPSFRPSEADFMAFQKELQKAMESHQP